jgi:hypothetical protein
MRKKLKGAAKAAAARRAAAGLPPAKKKPPSNKLPKVIDAAALGPIRSGYFYPRKALEVIFACKKTKLDGLVNDGIFPPFESRGGNGHDGGYWGQTILDIQARRMKAAQLAAPPAKEVRDAK